MEYKCSKCGASVFIVDKKVVPTCDCGCAITADCSATLKGAGTCGVC